MSTSNFTEAELEAFLNRMLEAERAGAKALLVFMGEHERGSAAWKTLRGVQSEEAHNCARIGGLLKRTGADYSHATGEFHDKALAVRGRRARIEFLLRGLGWAVREIDRALPRIDDQEARKTLEGMRDTHGRSIEACAAAARTLKD